MSYDEIGQFVCTEFDDFINAAIETQSSAGWNELRARLQAWFGALDEAAAFEGMLWVFEHRERYQYQELAGELLLRRRLKLRVPPEDFIRRIAGRLNASAESIAAYIKEVIGRDEALRCIRAVGDADENLRPRLAHLTYWLGGSSLW